MVVQVLSGMYLPTTYIFDVNQIQEADINSAEFKELLVRMYQYISNICKAVNLKDTGYYMLGEFVNGQLFFPNPAYSSITSSAPSYRQDFRFVMNFGALPNTATKSVAHGLTPNTAWIATRIYACASDTTGLTYIPIPSVSATISIDATNVNITTIANLSNYNECIVVFEYIKF